MHIPDDAPFVGYLRRDGQRQVLKVVGGNSVAQTRRRLMTHLAEREADSCGVVCILPAGDSPARADVPWDKYVRGVLPIPEPGDPTRKETP